MPNIVQLHFKPGKRWARLGLHARIILIWSALVMVGFLVGSGFLIRNAWEERRIIIERALAASLVNANAFEREVAATGYLLKGLSRSPALLSGDLNSFYEQLVATPKPDGSWLVLWDRDRQLLNTLRPFGAELPQIADFSSLPESRRRIRERGLSVSDRVHGVVAGHDTVSISLRLDGPNGEMNGRLTIQLPVARLDTITRGSVLPTGWQTYILDRKFVPVAASFTELGRPLRLPPNVAERILAQAGSGVLFGHDGAVDVLVAYYRLRSPEFTTVTKVPLALVNAPVVETTFRIALAGAGLTVLGALASLLVARQVGSVEILKKRAEDHLRSAKAEIEHKRRLLQRVVEISPDVIYVFDVQELRNVFLGGRVDEVLGYGPEDVHAMGGEVLAQLVHPEDFPKVMEHLTRVKDLRDSEIVTIEYRMRDTADRYRWLRSKETVFSRAPDGRVSRVLGVATEISDMKAAQDEIVDANERLRSILANARQSAAEFKLAFDMIPALAWQASSSGTLEALNQRWLEYTGISTENALNGGWLTAFHPDDAHHILSVWRDRLASGEGGETEGRMRRFDGTYRSFLMRSEPLRSEQGGIIRWFGTNTDIEDIKRAERLLAEEKRLLEMVATGQPASEVLNALCQAVEALTEGTCAAILLLDPDTSSLRHGASPSLPESYTHAASSRRISPRTSSLRTTDCSEETFVDDVASGPPWADYCDLPLEHDLRAIWSTPIRSSDGAMLGIIALYAHTARTISSEEERRVEQFTHIVSIVIERGRMDAGLRASVVEKEVLLKEVHHRVKNNLQLISSLLSLQAGRSRDGAEAERFAESRNRVRSMALVHENLYRTGDFASVSMASHVKALCAQLFQAYRLNGQQADLITDIDDLELDLDRAVSVGLIINELVSNALKHAFPDGRAGRVQVSLKQPDGGACALTVRDDGVGLPPGHEAGQSATLGLQLVQDLTQQLHGTMIITRQNGTAFTVTFDTSPEGVRP